MQVRKGVSFVEFLSTPSARRATWLLRCRQRSSSYFYPRPPRGGRPAARKSCCRLSRISIHALREEGDLVIQPFGQMLEDFYPRPPRGGRRSLMVTMPFLMRFLSTPSARRATVLCSTSCIFSRISIHALREEGDPGVIVPAGWLVISIHALREEGDLGTIHAGIQCFDFYPRPPRGGRHGPRKRSFHSDLFLSTPSARRATAKTETKSLFSNKLYNILHEFRRALIYNGSKSYPNHAK